MNCKVHRFRRRLIGVVLSFCLLSSSSIAFADGRILGIFPTLQEKSEWCWAASGERILVWYGYLSYSQCDVHWSAQLNCWNTQDTLGGVNYALWDLGNISGDYVSSQIAWTTYVNNIEQSMPVGFRWAWSSGGGHIMVAKGWIYDPYIDERYVEYVDSWDSTTKRVTWAEFQGGAGSDHTWTHTLHNIW